jgi:mRNA-degrading endonuclease RelE of RelBE toxin-antitoxin system
MYRLEIGRSAEKELVDHSHGLIKVVAIGHRRDIYR